jgi:hypothetical protein
VKPKYGAIVRCNITVFLSLNSAVAHLGDARSEMIKQLRKEAVTTAYLHGRRHISANIMTHLRAAAELLAEHGELSSVMGPSGNGIDPLS